MEQAKNRAVKRSWRGRIFAVQPRIRLMRSFDERQHNYPGYVLSIDGECDGKPGKFGVAVGKATHKKYQFRNGMLVRGLAVAVPDPRLERAHYYKTSRINILLPGPDPTNDPPPYTGIAPGLDIYRQRGHRRLDVQTYQSRCRSCIWGCCMPVEITLDHWNPAEKSYRFETFCYGPKNCESYVAGPPRKVPGRNGMIYTEEDWVDEEATAHRGPLD